MNFLFRNVPTSAKQVHTCPDCGKEYNNKKNLVDHQKIKHQNILPFSCEHCEITKIYMMTLIDCNDKLCRENESP